MRRVTIGLLFGVAMCLFAQQGFRLTPEDQSFSVSFPSEPIHQHRTSNSGLGDVEAHAYSVENSSWKFVLSYVNLMPVNPSDALDSAIGEKLKNVGGKLLSEESMTVSGRPAKTVKISAGESTIIDGRFVYVKPRLYQLLVVYRSGTTPSFEQQFFDSFTVTMAAGPEKENADVVGVSIRATAIDYRGPCPVMVHFRGIIRVSRIPLKLKYYWERGGGKTQSKNVELAADAIPKLDVADDFAIGTSGRSFRATDRLHVFTDAGEVVSDTEESTGHCSL